MDFLITGFFLWIFNKICPPTNVSKSNLNDTEIGAAYFFGTQDFKNDDSNPVNEDYDNGPDW